MSIKTTHLFILIACLFASSFYIVNLKFDKFYRVNGINNDNRVLLEKYLTEDEQEYLINNQIQIGLFIDYLSFDQFHLSNYEYYNILKNSGRYSKISQILDTGNALSSRLNYLFNDKGVDRAEQLVTHTLENAFLTQENFNFNYIDIYKSMSSIYTDYSYVDDVDIFLERLRQEGITSLIDQVNAFVLLCQSYTESSLKELLTTTTHIGQLVINPNDYLTTLTQEQYIASYEPKDLILIQDIPRVRYAMYLRSNAYQALKMMYDDLSESVEGFVLREAFVDSLEDSNGHSENQLGTMISLTQTQVSNKDFEDCELSQWLNENAHKYGYILRYPRNKASITNQQFNPHIYKYVGVDAATEMNELGLCLEEYNAYLSTTQ